MRKNRVLAACRDGAVSIGSWVSTNDALCAQIMANSGFDWLVVDMEHGPVPITGVQHAINAIRTTTTEPFVRAGWNASASIQLALDCGASGIMVPMINTVDDARRAVRDTRFEPIGQRSRGGVRAALSFATSAPTYFARANDELLLMAQIETVEAIANLDAIASVDGIDCLFVGPNDLAASYGLDYPQAWEQKSSAYAEAIAIVPRTAKRCGKIPGILASSAAMARECIDLGYTLVGIGSDATLLWNAAKRERGLVEVPPVA
jgi:4-hydroxy-2-oxoheptanedioate aldolase